MDGKTIFAIIIAVGISLGILYALDTYLFGGKSDIWQNVIKIATVLITVGIAAWVTKHLVHKEGIKVAIEK